MLQSDLFEVAPMPLRSGAVVRLPRYVEPAEDEALISLVAQLSADLGLSPLMLGRTAFRVDGRAEPDWWRRPSPESLAWISSRTGIVPDRLRAMTFVDWASARDDEDAERFVARRWRTSTPNRTRGRRVDICPRCIAGDARPYMRLSWMIGWVGVCPRHCLALTGACPSCSGMIRVESLKARFPIDLLACRRCGSRLAGVDGIDAHAAAIRLQGALVSGKRNGIVALPGMGELDWPTMMAVIDMLLGMVWVNTRGESRERLFARIDNDLMLNAAERMAAHWQSNYGGLLILAWLLEDLRVRLPAAVAILCAPRFDRMLGRLPDINDKMSERLRSILAPAVAKRPVGRRSWRPWIESLVESAADLRVRAARERYKHRRQRLTALAELNDGASVEAAAARTGVQPRSVYRWLHRGARHGLEAVLERPTGKPALTSAQAETLAQWIAADRLHQNRRAIAKHANALFGVALNLEAASKLLAKHGQAKPGHRRRLWTPKRWQGVETAGSTHDPAPCP